MRWVGGTLLALLALAWALVVFAAPTANVRPAPDDRGIGGLSLLVAALRDAGYRVAFDPASRPHLAKGDVAIVPVLQRETTFETPDVVIEHAKAGGHAFVMGIPQEVQPLGETMEVHDVARRRAKVDQTVSAPLPGTEDVASATDWGSEGGAISTLAQVGTGRIARLDDGALATNRFLGRLDNARVVLSTLSKVAAPGDRLVFLAMGYGEDEARGPIEAIGPWAVGALWQSLAVMAAFGLARGIRFGLPEPDVRLARGSHELLDALAGIYAKGRRTDAALGAAARERPDDPEARALAARAKVPESEALRALGEFEARRKRR